MAGSEIGDGTAPTTGYTKGTIASGTKAAGAIARGLAGAVEAGLGEFAETLAAESITRISLRNGVIVAYIKGCAKFYERLPAIAEDVLEHIGEAPEFGTCGRPKRADTA